MSLADLRQQLLDDMRDSPFEQHSLALGPYLRGQRGDALLSAIATAAGVSRGRVESALGPNSDAGLFLVVPRSGDRYTWDATDPIVVVGTATNIRTLAL